jgi:hypothetical protein
VDLPAHRLGALPNRFHSASGLSNRSIFASPSSLRERGSDCVSLPWVKLHTSLLDNETFQRFTPAAKLTFLTALMIAGKQDLGGRLEAPPFGAIDSKAIASKTGCRIRMQDEALSELVTAGFLSVDLHGTFVIERWDEKAGDESRLANQRARVKRFRDKHRNVTRNGETVTDKEEEVEFASLRSAAIDYGKWPAEPEILSSLALVFIARFANCADPRKAGKYLSPYSSFLAGMRRDGYTIEQVWQACEDCWVAGDRVPLWGGTIARVRQHLPGRGSDAPARRRDNDRGDSMKQALTAKERRDMAS